MQTTTLIALNGFMLGMLWRRFFDQKFTHYGDEDVLRGLVVAAIFATVTVVLEATA